VLFRRQLLGEDWTTTHFEDCKACEKKFEGVIGDLTLLGSLHYA